MAEKFKSTDYVKIIQSLVPELEHAKNPLDIGMIEKLPSLKNIILLEDSRVNGMLNFNDLLTLHTSKDASILEVREQNISFEDTVNIQFTSGTTGYPKGAALSHHNILNNALYIGEYLRITEKDKIVIPVPLYHCFGMVIGNLGCLNYGATMVYPSEWFDS